MVAPLGACAAGAGVGAAGGTLAAALQFFAAAQCVLREPWPAAAAVRNTSCFDFVVVGGGTAGAALAGRLAERPDFRVLLLEAGPDPPQESIIPGFSKSIMGTSYDWNFRTSNDGVSSQALVEGAQTQPRGRMLGGSGSLNDMVYARGFPADYDDWAETLGDNDWKWDNVLPYFMKTEHLTDERIVNDPELMKLHGRGGDIEVAGLNESTFETDMFLKAFQELGFELVKDMTSPAKIGAGRHSHTIREGRRDSTLTAILNKAASKDNLFVLKNAFVTKILMSNKTAYGVKAKLGEKEFHFYAGKEVIVSAGTFNTPKLLMLSGIGPREHLEKLNIKVVADLPVGDNLHDHVMVLTHVAADNGTCYAGEARPYMDMIRYLYDRGGPLSLVNTMAAYKALNASTEQNVPDFAYYPSCMPIGTNFYSGCLNLLRFNENVCSALQKLLKEQEVLTVATVLLKPKSRGTVRLRSADPHDTPIILSGTFSDASDLDGYPEAINVTNNIVNTEYFKRKNARVVNFDIEGCKGKEGDEAVRCRARALAMSAWHAAGTAAMGRVADARLRVRGVAALRVVDASVMPRVVRGNTNAPVVMIAEKAATYIKADYSRS
ncbi:ecdysone oxidase-like [Pectinophora gossypiella]|uniref:ecdysone oxidase-like n=1 Tax=Pectinophora gossypiella TaxID=13191 RepID=UPI00214E11CF|nr:ecdysone oxidase-like [Pectinophora gossypiella]